MAPHDAVSVTAGPLTVRRSYSDVDTVRQLAVLASVPGRFRVALETEEAQVALVSTASAHWVDECRQAIGRPGTRGVLLTNAAYASPASVRELNGLAASAGVVVVVSSPFAVPWLRLDEGSIQLAGCSVSARVTSPELGRGSKGLSRAVLQAFDVLRRLVGETEALVVRHADEHAILASCTTTEASRPVIVECVLSAAVSHRIEVDVVGSRRRWRFAHTADTTAGGAELSRSDRLGRLTQAHRYEGGERMAWRRLYDAVTVGKEDVHDLLLLADDLSRLPPKLFHGC